MKASVILFASILAANAAYPSVMPPHISAIHHLPEKVRFENFRTRLEEFAEKVPGIGVCLISDSDTTGVNHDRTFAMMSVVKLYQAVAVARLLGDVNENFSVPVKITSADLPTNTWSPLAQLEHPDEFYMPIEELLGYSLKMSDNNACDILFESICTPAETDSIVRSMRIPGEFAVSVTESDQNIWPPYCERNYCTPLHAASLISRMYTGETSRLDLQMKTQEILESCETGTDRIPRPLTGSGATVAHKTGSGWEKDGTITACNDVAYVILPDGTGYALSIFLRDYKGTGEEAARTIATVSGWAAEAMGLFPDVYRGGSRIENLGVDI